MVEVASGQPAEKIRELIKDGGLEGEEVLKQGVKDLSEHVEKRMKEYLGESVTFERVGQNLRSVQENGVFRQVLEVSFMIGKPPLGLMVARREIDVPDDELSALQQTDKKDNANLEKVAPNLRVIDSYSSLSGLQKGVGSAYQEARTDAEFKGIPARQKELLFALQEFPGKTERSFEAEEAVRSMWRGEAVINYPREITATFSGIDLKVEEHESAEPITRSVSIPFQLFVDLERDHALSIKGQSILTNEEIKNYNRDAASVKDARIVKEVSRVEEEIGQVEAQALFRVMAQGIWIDIIRELSQPENNNFFGQTDYLNLLEEGELLAGTTEGSSPVLYNFSVDAEDNIHVSIRQVLGLNALNAPELLNDQVTVGKILVKREIIVPRSELRSVGEGKETDAPGLKVIDTYSKVYKELDDDVVEAFDKADAKTDSQ